VAHHRRNGVERDDRSGKYGFPQGVDVGCGRVDPAVSVAAHREVEDVGAQPLVVEVADRGAAGHLVGAQERRVGHAGRPAHPLVDQIVERDTRCPPGEQRQHHVAAVPVVEPLAGFVLHRVTVQRGEELLNGRQLVDRHRQDVVVVVGQLILVEVSPMPTGEPSDRRQDGVHRQVFGEGAVATAVQQVTEHLRQGPVHAEDHVVPRGRTERIDGTHISSSITATRFRTCRGIGEQSFSTGTQPADATLSVADRA
jgi:hypothetical protein